MNIFLLNSWKWPRKKWGRTNLWNQSEALWSLSETGRKKWNYYCWYQIWIRIWFGREAYPWRWNLHTRFQPFLGFGGLSSRYLPQVLWQTVCPRLADRAWSEWRHARAGASGRDIECNDWYLPGMLPENNGNRYFLTSGPFYLYLGNALSGTFPYFSNLNPKSVSLRRILSFCFWSAWRTI